MAVTAKFQADFSDFQHAVQNAELNLRSFKTGAAEVERQLTKTSEAFSGRKVLQEAELAVKAVKELGGVTQLTEKEQADLNAKLTEAIAKYQALGKVAPNEMREMAAATKSVEKSTTDVLGTIGKLGGAIGIGFSVGAVINFGKSVLDTAGQINDLASQMGISTDAVQGFKFAAEQAGSSLDTVGTAITKMNAHLSEGDKSTVKALEDAGLKFADIANLKPEDAFLAIADAIQKIPDPMKQSEVALKLFGKTGAELLPAIKEGFRGVSDGASKMSADTIKALDDAGDAWQSLYNRVVIATGGLIAETSRAVTGVTNNWKQFVDNASQFGVAIALSLASAQEKIKNIKPPDINLPVNKPKQTKQDEDDALKRAKDLKAIQDQLFGRDLIARAQGYVSALGSLSNLSHVSDENQKKLNKDVGEALEAYKLLGKTAPQAMRDLFVATAKVPDVIAGIPASVGNVGAAFDVVIPKIYDASNLLTYISGIPFGQKIGDELKKPDFKKLKLDFGDLSRALSELAQVSGSTFGGMISSLGQLVSAANTAQKSIELLHKSQKDGEKGTVTGFLDMTTGIIGIVTAAIAAGKAVASLFGLFDRNKGRDLVVDFAESFGGFDQLHAKLQDLGDQGEQLWIKLTQGVGRNNPDQARKVIDEVTAALDKQAQQHEDTQAATEEEAAATVETATQALKALDDLGVRLTTNEEEWATWAAAVNGDIASVAATLNGLSLPVPNQSSAGTVPFTSGSGATTVHIVVPVSLDGNAVTESVAYHTLTN